MQMRRYKIMLYLVVAWLAISSPFFWAAQAQDPQPQAGASTILKYLPIIQRGHPANSIFGVEIAEELDNPNVGGPAYNTKQIGAILVRHNGLKWASVEPTPGARQWDSLLETRLLNARKYNLNPILIIRNTPTWAQAIPGQTCGRIKTDNLDEFANFMRDVVARYSKGPYYVRYFEIWNEPDIDPYYFPYEHFGCWGDATDTRYYGGGYYAEVLKAVVPAMRQVDSTIQVLVGGLLLTCNPDNPPPGRTDGCLPSKYLAGILANGGGPYFDGVSFHAYDYFPNKASVDTSNPNHSLGNYSNPNWLTAWNTTGPTMIAKANYLRKVLNQYGYSGKYLINTEDAIVCGDDPLPNPYDEPLCNSKYPIESRSFQNTKAYFVVQTYAAARWLNLKANIWYGYFGWRDSGLYNAETNQPTPAYNAYNFARQQMNWVHTANQIGPAPYVSGYELLRNDRKIWVLWYFGGNPVDGTASTAVNLPAMPVVVWRWVDWGSGLPNAGTYQPAATGLSLSIGRAPVFIEFTP